MADTAKVPVIGTPSASTALGVRTTAASTSTPSTEFRTSLMMFSFANNIRISLCLLSHPGDSGCRLGGTYGKGYGFWGLFHIPSGQVSPSPAGSGRRRSVAAPLAAGLAAGHFLWQGGGAPGPPLPRPRGTFGGGQRRRRSRPSGA